MADTELKWGIVLDKNKLFAAAEKFVVKGQYDKALESFEQILRADPSDTKTLNRVADLYLKKNDTLKGIDTLKKLGEAYTNDGFYSKAVAIYKRILKVDSGGTKESLVEIHEKLAELYGQLGLISDAMSHFSIVVDVHDRMGDQEALLKALKKVSDLDPYNIDSQLKLIELFVAQNKSADAQETFEKLSEHVNAKGHMPDVLRVYEHWVQFFPKDYVRLKELVDHYIQVNEPKKALARIQVAFKADPRDPAVLELLSMTFVNLKQPEKAKAVDIELLKIYRQAGDSAQASEVENRLQGKVPPPLEEPTRKTEAVAAHDEIDPADSLIQSLALDPDERKILSECDVYSKYGLNDKAYEVLSASLKKFSQSIALRWKLKSVAMDRHENEMAAHLLSEIILLAKSKSLKAWEDVAVSELRMVDPQHATLGGTPAKSGSAKNPPETLEVLEDSAEFRSSDISIVLEEEVVEPLRAPIPEVEAVSEIEIDSDSDPEPLLTESDFSDEELQKLAASLDPNPASTDAPMELESNDVSLRTSDMTMAEEAQEMELSPQLELSSEPMQMEEDIPPPASAASPALDADFEIRQALDEVAFFKQQGLQHEADQLLKTLNAKFPGHALLNQAGIKAPNEKLKKNSLEIEALGRKVKLSVQEDQRSGDEENFFDLGAALDDELKNAPKFEGPSEVKDVFQAFKQGVSQVVNDDDWQTHFDLGVAYREMGLIDDAVGEFQIVLKTESQQSSALYQLGICEVGRGNFGKAKDYFDQALKIPNLMEQEKISISYELADALLHLNDKARAKKLFEEIQSQDPEFREVTLKIQSLG